MKKIFEISELQGKLKNTTKKRIILTGGTFDFLNPGHIDLFDFAKTRGDILIVAVNSDGNYTPVEERLEILEAIEKIDLIVKYLKKDELKDIIEFVDEIVINDEFEYSPDKVFYSGNSIAFNP